MKKSHKYIKTSRNNIRTELREVSKLKDLENFELEEREGRKVNKKDIS